VRQPLELVEAQKSARALDGVQAAKRAVDALALARVGLERDQVDVELVEQLTTLGEKLRQELRVHRLARCIAHWMPLCSRLSKCFRKATSPSRLRRARRTWLSLAPAIS
jgi:hypothetical protein